MKPTWQRMLEPVRERLSSYELIEHDAIDSIVSIELMIYGSLLMDPTIKVEDSWAILAGHNYPILKANTNLAIIDRLRILLSEYRFEKYWCTELTNYFNYERRFRIFDKNKVGKVIPIKPVIMPDRDLYYEKILTKPLMRIKDERSFARSGSFRYSRIIDGIKQEYNGFLPNTLLEDQTQLLPLYKEKIELNLNIKKDWETIVYEMDEKTNHEKSYRARAKFLDLKSVYAAGEKIFKYKGNQHIGGALSSGKSTFMIIETYRIVKKNSGKVGFIEGSVAQVLDRVQELRNLGIKAVPIIGKSSRERHERNFLMSNAGKISEATDLVNGDFALLAFVSDRCTIKALADDFERNNYYPCMDLKVEIKKLKCPLAHTCGVYKEVANLLDADVWVATSASVLKSKFPAVVDPYERTVYEAMYDLLDVIFVDEADYVQKQFDEVFITELPAFGSENNLFEIELSKFTSITIAQYGKYASDRLINRWQTNLRHLEAVIWKLYDKLNKSKTLRSYLKNRIIWIRTLIAEISHKLSNSRSEKEIKDDLWHYANDPFATYGLADLADQLLNANNINDKEKVIARFIREVRGEFIPNINEDLLKDQIELFLYIARLDSGITFMLTYYTAVQSRLGTGSDHYYIASFIREFQPFMKEAMTGFMLGYRYDMKVNEEVGSFKLIEYSGIGRYLLTEWHKIFENAYGHKGPSIILLSGTSHLPGSSHYHVDVEPKWIIESNKQSSIITQQFLPKYDEDNDREIPVSGTDHNRGENLRKLVSKIKPDIQWELNFWKSKKENRGVILVVNSYDDVKEIEQTFTNDLNWQGKFRLLSKENICNDVWHSRSLIENFAESGAQVLVAPLLAVGRGYNILNENKEAFFGSAFFLVRPYPIPNDMTFIIQSLHANLNYYYSKIEHESLTYASGLKKIRNLSRKSFEIMYRKPDFWSILNEKEREILSWYIFVPTWQMIGRLIRGGKNARIFYCDAKFHEKNKNGQSLLEYWQKLMDHNKEQPVFKALYEPFIASIQDAIQGELF